MVGDTGITEVRANGGVVRRAAMRHAEQARRARSANVIAPSEPAGWSGSSTTAIRSGWTVAPRVRKSCVVRRTSIGIPWSGSACRHDGGVGEHEADRREQRDDRVLGGALREARGMDGPAVRLEPRAADRGEADQAARHRFGGSAGGRRSRTELARPVTGWRAGFRRMAKGVRREVMLGLRGVGDWRRARSQVPAATATGTAARSWRQTEPTFGGGHELTYLFERQTIKPC